MNEQKTVLKESWSWASDEYIRFLRQTEAGSVYRVRAIHVTKTLNRFVFSEEELRAAGRTLGFRPLNLNHEAPLPFPENRVIDAEFEDDAVEALIVVADPCVMDMIQRKDIVAVSIEGQFRWADLVCDDQECAWHPKGVILTGLALLTPGVEPGDPLASIVLKKAATNASALRNASLRMSLHPSPVIPGTALMADTTPKTGGVLMEKAEATPPLEPTIEETSKPTEAKTPEEATANVTVDANCAQKVLDAVTTLTVEVKGLRDHVGSLESQVKLLQEQRRKGTQRT